MKYVLAILFLPITIIVIFVVAYKKVKLKRDYEERKISYAEYINEIDKIDSSIGIK